MRSGSAAEISSALPALVDEDPTKNHLGLNAASLNDWDGSYGCVDAMKQARPWQDAADWHKPVGGIDALGWPTADASTVIVTGTPAHINGTYKLSFNGQADVALMWSAGSVSHKVYDAATNTTTADVTYALESTGSVGLIFTNTRRTAADAKGTGFTNVRLIRPGYPAQGGAFYTTEFLDAFANVGTVRMMDWSNTNANVLQHWSDRRTPAHMSKIVPDYTGPGGQTWPGSDAGVAIEHQIELCNELKADCWINVPVVADDDYVRKLALAIRYGTDGTEPYTSPQENPVYPPLDPSLRVYLEYANEIWNSAWGFSGFPIVQDIVGTLPPEHPLLDPPESNQYYLMWRYPAYRIAVTSDIFREVYGDASMMNRVRPVLMTQQGNAQDTLKAALLWLDAYARRQVPAREVGSYVYGAGGSGYYFVNNPPADTKDVDAFFAPGNYPATENVTGFRTDSIWAASFGLKHVAYEGGPTLDNYPEADAKAINADPRMLDMMLKTHKAWSAVGGDLLVYYTLTGTPRWDFTPDISNLATPKLQALAELAGQTKAAVTVGPALPGILVATSQDHLRLQSGDTFESTCGTQSCLSGLDVGELVALTGHADTAFTGTLKVRGMAAAGATMNVWVNGKSVGQVTLPKGTSLVDSNSLSVDIASGLVVVRLEVVSGSPSLRSIVIR